MNTTTGRPELTWTPPSGHSWSVSLEHKATPFTVPARPIIEHGLVEGFADWTKRYGVALSHLQPAYVNGYQYGRPVIAGVPDKPGAKRPPERVLRVLVRLVPELRRRNKAAKRTLATQAWRADIERWTTVERPKLIAGHLVLQAVDPAGLDDAALAAHVTTAAERFRHGAFVHFASIGMMGVPVGRFLATAQRGGMSPAAALDLLRGATTATTGAVDAFTQVASAARDAGIGTITSVDDVRRDPAAARMLDEAMTTWGWRLVGGVDLDAPTLAERPDLVLALLNAGPPATPGEADLADVRRAVPATERAELEARWADAKAAYSMRDDNTSLTMLWPAGLLRRALVEAGHRLAASGRVEHADHVFELTIEETTGLLRGGTAPAAAETAERAAERAAAALATPPATLGPPSGPPPGPSVFPGPLAEVTGAVMLMTRTIFAPAATGHGVGAAPVTARAVVVRDVADAMDRVEPGDIIVTTGTNPGFNAVLAIAGGLVLETGGLLSHGAIAARELGIPAVVGLPGATSRFPDGALITVDPTAPSVTLAS